MCFLLAHLVKANFLPFDLDLATFLAAFSLLAAALTFRLGILGAGGASRTTGASIVVMSCVSGK